MFSRRSGRAAKRQHEEDGSSKDSGTVDNASFNYTRCQSTGFTNKKRPGNIFTCYEINGAIESNRWVHYTVNSCSHCDNFRNERLMKKKLRDLKSQGDAPVRYQCEFLWRRRRCIVSEPVGQKEAGSNEITSANGIPPPSAEVSQENPVSESAGHTPGYLRSEMLLCNARTRTCRNKEEKERVIKYNRIPFIGT
jgi:hypothetical protein